MSSVRIGKEFGDGLVMARRHLGVKGVQRANHLMAGGLKLGQVLIQAIILSPVPGFYRFAEMLDIGQAGMRRQMGRLSGRGISCSNSARRAEEQQKADSDYTHLNHIFSHREPRQQSICR
jgi:hypothetical protein